MRYILLLLTVQIVFQFFITYGPCAPEEFVWETTQPRTMMVGGCYRYKAPYSPTIGYAFEGRLNG